MLLAEECQIVWSKVILLRYLLNCEACGLKIYQHIHLSLGIYPVDGRHSECFLKLTIECGRRHLHEHRQLFHIDRAIIMLEYLLSKLEIIVLHRTKHEKQVLLII